MRQQLTDKQRANISCAGQMIEEFINPDVEGFVNMLNDTEWTIYLKEKKFATVDTLGEKYTNGQGTEEFFNAIDNLEFTDAIIKSITYVEHIIGNVYNVGRTFLNITFITENKEPDNSIDLGIYDYKE